MYKSLKRYVQTGTANAINSLSTPIGRKLLVHQVTISYSNTPTQAGVTVNLDSGAGAGYDAVLLTGDANARYTIFPINLTKPFILMEDDVLVITAPAGGGSLTSSITILAQEL